MAYGRDRGEEDTQARIFSNTSEIDLEEYNYYWDGNKWSMVEGE